MQFKITLKAKEAFAVLPFNYQYPLSSAIYKILQKADKDFNFYLHSTGYGAGHKSFKLFTFSDIKTPFNNNGDRMYLQSDEAELITSFYLPQAAETFLKSLFLHQHLVIADIKSKAAFTIANIETLPDGHFTEVIQRIIVQPLSPLVVGKKNVRGHYDYRSPEDEDFSECLLQNWLEKYKTVFNVEAAQLEILKSNTRITVKLLQNPPQKRLITIKSGTEAQTRIRAYTRFRMEIVAPKEMLELALGAGLGLHNAQGFGCIGLLR